MPSTFVQYEAISVPNRRRCSISYKNTEPQGYASLSVINPGQNVRTLKKITGTWPPLVQVFLDVLEPLDDETLWREHGVVRDDTLDPPYRYVHDIGKTPLKYNKQCSHLFVVPNPSSDLLGHCSCWSYKPLT